MRPQQHLRVRGVRLKIGFERDFAKLVRVYVLRDATLAFAALAVAARAF